MARRRKTKTRTVTRYVKRSSGRRARSKSMDKLVQIDSMAYGAVRGYVSNLLIPLTSKIPLGSVADEIGMGFLNYMLAKKGSGMVKKVALKGLTIENARLGEALATGGLNLGGSNTTTSNSTFMY